MILRNMARSMHNIGTQDSKGDQFSTQLLKNTQYLTNIKLIYRLSSALQQHRGSTMASLSGSVSFFERIQELQTIINKSFFAVKLNSLHHTDVLPVSQLSHAIMDWHSIEQGWQDDTVIDNYEFHGHLISALSKISKQFFDKIVEGCDPQLLEQHQEFLNALLVELPEFIELLAKLRGLCTISAVIKACGPNSHSRISFLIKDIRTKNEELTETISSLNSTYDYLPSSQKLTKQKQRVKKIANKVETKILNTRVIKESSEDLFDSMTEIIDAQWDILNKGLDLAERLIYNDLYVHSKLENKS